MTAGTGVLHSEFNYSPVDPVHLLQIWIIPEKKGLKPGYEQKSFSAELQPGKLVPVVSKEPKNGALKINQDVELLIGKLGPGDKVNYELKPDRHAWVQVAEGSVTLNGKELKTGDAAAVDNETSLTLTGKENSQVLLFDLN